MGSCYKKELFNEHVQQGVLGWAQKVKMRKGLKGAASKAEPTSNADSAGLLLRLKWRKLGRTLRPLGTQSDRTVGYPCCNDVAGSYATIFCR